MEKAKIILKKNSVLMLFIKIKSGECFFFSSGKLFPDLGVGTCWERNLLVAKETCTPDERIPCTRCYAGICGQDLKQISNNKKTQPVKK